MASGDHHLFRKPLPYEGSSHIPFLVASHHLPLTARPVPSLVCLEDILPTVLDLAGLPVPEGVDGRSLVPVLRGETEEVRSELYGEHAGQFAHHYLVHGRHKDGWWEETNEEQLFDLEADPHELNDLSAEAALRAPMRERMKKRLAGRADYSYEIAQLRPLANGAPSVFWK